MRQGTIGLDSMYAQQANKHIESFDDVVRKMPVSGTIGIPQDRILRLFPDHISWFEPTAAKAAGKLVGTLYLLPSAKCRTDPRTATSLEVTSGSDTFVASFKDRPKLQRWVDQVNKIINDLNREKASTSEPPYDRQKVESGEAQAVKLRLIKTDVIDVAQGENIYRASSRYATGRDLP